VEALGIEREEREVEANGLTEASATETETEIEGRRVGNLRTGIGQGASIPFVGL